MSRGFVRVLLFSFIAYTFLLNINCQKKGIDTAVKLAEALKKEGINYQTIDDVEIKLKFAKIDEVFSLKGDSLWLEIFRIENLKGYNLAVQAVKMRFIVEQQMITEPEEKIEDAFFKHPFIVVVKQEPVKGAVKQILINKIFPTKKDG